MGIIKAIPKDMKYVRRTSNSPPSDQGHEVVKSSVRDEIEYGACGLSPKKTTGPTQEYGACGLSPRKPTVDGANAKNEDETRREGKEKNELKRTKSKKEEQEEDREKKEERMKREKNSLQSGKQ